MGTSTTTPPSGTTSDPVPSLYLSDTFYTWFNTTNDLINKVNPVEVYTIRGITHTNHSVTFQAGGTGDFNGITLDDLGNGNWRIGYILPYNVTGGHEWHGHNHFYNGISGTVVNTFSGSTGDVIGVNTVNGYAPFVSGGSGNMTGCAMNVNGITVSASGAVTITAGDISGTLALATGTAGFVLGSTVTDSSVSEPFRLFSGYHDALQDALHLRGVAGNTKGANNLPRAVFGSTNLPTIGQANHDALVTIDSLGMSLNGQPEQHGLVIHQNLSKGYHIKSTGGFGLASRDGVFVDTGNNDFVIKKSTNADSGYTSGTELFRIENDSTLHLENIIQDSENYKASGASQGYFLISDEDSKMVWKDAPEGVFDYYQNAVEEYVVVSLGGGRYSYNLQVPNHVVGSTGKHLLTISMQFGHTYAGGPNYSPYNAFQVGYYTGDTDEERLWNPVSNLVYKYHGASNNASSRYVGRLFGECTMLVEPNGFVGKLVVRRVSAVGVSTSGAVPEYWWH